MKIYFVKTKKSIDFLKQIKTTPIFPPSTSHVPTMKMNLIPKKFLKPTIISHAPHYPQLTGKPDERLTPPYIKISSESISNFELPCTAFYHLHLCPLLLWRSIVSHNPKNRGHQIEDKFCVKHISDKNFQQLHINLTNLTKLGNEKPSQTIFDHNSTPILNFGAIEIEIENEN